MITTIRYKTKGEPMQLDILARRNVYLKTQAAKYQLALEKLFEKYAVGYADVIDDYTNEELIERMQQLQAEANADAAEVLGLTDEEMKLWNYKG